MNDDFSVRAGESDGTTMLGRVLFATILIAVVAGLGWLFSHMAT